MPGGDRTGPRGLGPLTGRRAGYCAGYDVPGSANPLPGYGRRFGGRGGGHGWRNWFYATGLPGWARAGIASPPREQELAGLQNEAEYLKNQLEAINRRIEQLEQK
jgi:hypothetical protein